MSGSMTRAALVAALATATAMALPRVAYAQPTAVDRSVAQAMFDDAKKLMASKDYAAACPKFAESQRLDPGMGTLFRLSQCQELIGQMSSAWSGYLEVAAMAKAAGQPAREDAARAEAARVEPLLSRLSIAAPSPPPGLEVKRNGEAVGKAQWGLALPIDPGSHIISASAPGKKPWQTTVEVRKPGETVTTTVPALEDAPVEVAPVVAVPPVGAPVAGTKPVGPAVPEGPPVGRTQRIVAVVTGGVGLGLLAVGTGFGIQTFSLNSDSLEQCRPGARKNECTQEGVTLRESAVTAGNVSTAMFVVGTAAVVGGVVVWFTAPSKRPAPKAGRESHSPTVAVSIQPAGVTVQGAWW